MIGLQTIGYARPRQLLINNDFQVNQRGENSYAEGEYTIDMWFAEKGMLGVTNNGIVFTKVWQKLDVLKDINYVFVYKIHNGGVFHINILSNNGTYQDEQLKVTLLTNEMHTKITIESISGTQFNRCNYFDLFEGDIALPHRKEDYSIALLRCRRKVHTIVNGRYKNIPCILTYYNNYLSGYILTNLDGYTTVIANGHFTIYAISNGQGNIENIILDKFYFDYTHNLLQIVVPESLRSRFSNGVTCLVQTYDSGKIVLSCEPTP